MLLYSSPLWSEVFSSPHQFGEPPLSVPWGGGGRKVLEASGTLHLCQPSGSDFRDLGSVTSSSAEAVWRDVCAVSERTVYLF